MSTDGRFAAIGTTSVDLGPCRCPGTPHPDGDSAEVYDRLGWDDIVDIGLADTEGAARRAVLARAIARWTLVANDGDGDPASVPISEATVRLLDDATRAALWAVAETAFRISAAPLPNASGAPSRRSRRESASPTRTTPMPAKPTS